jgi:hypothetical protein
VLTLKRWRSNELKNCSVPITQTFSPTQERAQTWLFISGC